MVVGGALVVVGLSVLAVQLVEVSQPSVNAKCRCQIALIPTGPSNHLRCLNGAIPPYPEFQVAADVLDLHQLADQSYHHWVFYAERYSAAVEAPPSPEDILSSPCPESTHAKAQPGLEAHC